MKVERKWLLAILVLSFALRSLPFIWGVIPGLDSYLHRDIALRILEKKGLLSYDLLSLIGLKAYSYPAGFHLLLALFLTFLNDRVACQVVPALSGTLSVLLVFYLAKEFFSDERISLGAAFLLSTSPSHIYRSSLCIPESVGILFYISSIFFAARFLKERKVLNLLWLAIIMTFYLFFHRGWFFAFLTLGIIFSFNFYDTLFLKKKNLIFLLVLILFLSIFAKSLFFELLLRFPREPVTALGYLKWVGALQIFFATLSMLYLLKERDRMSYSLIAWALTLLGFGSISFRFRDPYSTFPVSLLASHFIMRHLVPFLNSLKLEGLKRISPKNLVFSSIFLLCISQALYTSLFLVEHPNPYELEALDFLEKNTPKDSIVLTWKEEGYYIIGIAERKDIVTWKKIYQGFFETPPSVDEARQSYLDVGTMFRGVDRERVFELFEEYSVDYVYIDLRMRTELESLRYGLVEYIGYDTHFKPLFSNKYTEVYLFSPQAFYPKDAEKIEIDPKGFDEKTRKHMSMVSYTENFWNGLSYINHENYRANYELNAQISEVYLELYEITSEEILLERAKWILEFLTYEQLLNGGFTDQNFSLPQTSLPVTCKVTEAFLEGYRNDLISIKPVEKVMAFILSQAEDSFMKTHPESEIDVYTTDAACLKTLVELYEFSQDKRFLELSEEVALNLVKNQREDGSWTYSEISEYNTVNSQVLILEGLVEYQLRTRDERVSQSIEKGISWLKSQQSEDGRFKDYVISKDNIIKTETTSYVKAARIYSHYEMKYEEDLTLSYLFSSYEIEREKRVLYTFLEVFDLVLEKSLDWGVPPTFF